MKIDSVNIVPKANPVLLDKVIQDMQKSLKERLPWLNYAFGRAYKLVSHELEGGKFIYPAAYTQDSEYVSLVPNDNFGNFCWFDIYDPQEVTTVSQGLPQLTFKGAIVFWFNLSTIYPDADFMYTEELKDEILRALTTPGIITSQGRLEITKLYERFENIYKGYSLEKIYNNYVYSGEDMQAIDKQFFMHPYGGLRAEFNLITRELCQRYIK